MEPLPSHIALVANGEILSYDTILPILNRFEKVVAVDGGLEHCAKMGINPCLIIGDFDSISEEILKKFSHVPCIRFPQEKDESDVEVSIKELLKRGVEHITLFAVLGKRVDHLLYNLYLLARYPSKLKIVSETETLFCLQKQNQINASLGQTISLIPLNTVMGVNTKGLKWEVQNVIFDKAFMSLSNICMGNSFIVNVESGDLLCCINHLS